MAEPLFFATASGWRDWLAGHHDKLSECLVGFHKLASGTASMSWSESVDEAICFGWIDGVRRGIDEVSYSIRFTPRKAGSTWSRINVEKVNRLRGAGLMQPSGEAAFLARREDNTAIYSYERKPSELTDEQVKRFTAKPAAWAFWEVQAAWYRRNATHWVTDAKRADTRARRLDQLITDSQAGRRLRHLSRDQGQ
jgi:uncharacterized protein YdeI (YjbR/CyaY-like superfamily)